MFCNLVIEDWNLRSAHRLIVKSALEATSTFEEAARALGIRVRTLQRQIAAFDLSNAAARHRQAKAAVRPHRSKR